MKKLILTIAFVCLPVTLFASGASIPLLKANTDTGDVQKLQRGAKYFANYCMGCHQLKYISYTRLSKGLELEEDQVKQYLMMSWDKDKFMSSYMTTAATTEQQKAMIGKAPPDLTLVTKYKNSDWVYTFLMSFYEDPKGEYGVGNALFPTGMGMPHVLTELQGLQKAVFEDHCAHGKPGMDEKTKKPICSDGKKPSKKFSHFIAAGDKGNPNKKGIMSKKEYKKMVTELVTFLEWAGDPRKLARHRTGVWVILFMILFTFVAYLLKKEYWRDVH